MYEKFIWLDSYLKKEKSVIEYLGTVYIMPDGCPTPNCDMNDPECVRTKRYVSMTMDWCWAKPYELV